jgi:hypothetical protein
MFHIDKEHLFPDQTKEKKEEGNPIYNINRFVLQEWGVYYLEGV